MRARRLSIAVALPAVAFLTALCAPTALGAPSTTPVPKPVNPGQPPFLDPNQQPLPPMVADAGSGLGLIRVLPGAVQTNSPGLTDEDEKKLPKQAAGEIGLGLASAQANSQAVYNFERSIAESSPFGFAVAGRAPRLPGALAQTASPDNAKPTTGGLTPPASPLDLLLKVGALEGSVQARWDDKLGPCVDPIADAKTSLASLSAINVIPALPALPDLKGVLPASTPKLGPELITGLIDGVKQLAAPLNQLGGLLSGQKREDGLGSLLRLPEMLSAQSTIRLVDVPGQAGKAVQATSTVQVASIQILAGTPQELKIDLVSKPKLVATSTGDPKTSTITYEAPVLRVSQGGKELGRLDARNPKLDVPIAVPLVSDVLKDVPKLPIIGDLLANGLKLPDQLRKLDIGVLRLNIAQLNEKRDGAAVGATARLLDLQLLPTDALPLPGLPSALAQIAIGEQVARAAAPAGGVVCKAADVPPPAPGDQPAPPAPGPQPAPPPKLAYTNAAYEAVPLFWTGTAMLLAGVIVVAALPSRRPRALKPPPTPTTE